MASGLRRLYGRGERRPANLDRKQSSEVSSVGPKMPKSIEIQDGEVFVPHLAIFHNEVAKKP